MTSMYSYLFISSKCDQKISGFFISIRKYKKVRYDKYVE
jgi:hypothetical protein